MGRWAPSAAELAASPKITIGDEEFAIPKLGARQLRVILPAAAKLRAANTAEMSVDQYDILVDVVHVALMRAYPEITREDVLDMPMTTLEMTAIVNVVMQQAGLARKADAPAGEANGEAAAGSPISTESSPA